VIGWVWTSVLVQISAFHKYFAVLIVAQELLVGHLYKHVVVNFVRSAAFKLPGDSAVDSALLYNWLVWRHHETL